MSDQKNSEGLSDMNVNDIQKDVEDILFVPFDEDEIVKLINYFCDRMEKRSQPTATSGTAGEHRLGDEIKVKRINYGGNPFCDACLEKDCVVSTDGTCAMIRKYHREDAQLTEADCQLAVCREALEGIVKDIDDLDEGLPVSAETYDKAKQALSKLTQPLSQREGGQ